MSREGIGAFPECVILRHGHNHHSPSNVVLRPVWLSRYLKKQKQNPL